MSLAEDHSLLRSPQGARLLYQVSLLCAGATRLEAFVTNLMFKLDPTKGVAYYVNKLKSVGYFDSTTLRDDVESPQELEQDCGLLPREAEVLWSAARYRIGMVYNHSSLTSEIAQPHKTNILTIVNRYTFHKYSSGLRRCSQDSVHSSFTPSSGALP